MDDGPFPRNILDACKRFAEEPFLTLLPSSLTDFPAVLPMKDEPRAAETEPAPCHPNCDRGPMNTLAPLRSPYVP